MRTSTTALVLVFFHLCPVSSVAQNTEDSAAFDFSLPGARSRGIGGAFVAIADDATSIYSNPAGLTLLFRPEVSAEGRHWSFLIRRPDRGHAFGLPTGEGIDTISGLVDGEWSSNVSELTFLSFVYPKGSWSVGVFHHQLARYHMERRTQGAFFDCRGGFRGFTPAAPFCEPHAIEDGVDRIFPAFQVFDLDIRSTGAGLASRLADNLAVGATAQYYDFEVNGSNRVYSARYSEKYSPANYADPANVEVISTQTGKDHAWGVNVGLLWNLSDAWVTGASFRIGPTLTFRTTTATGPATLFQNPGVVVDEPNTPFNIPNTFAAGVAYLPSPAWRLSFEYDRVQFSELMDGAKNTSTPADDPEGATVLRGLRVDDANQFRFGAEYARRVLGDRLLLALRSGIWYDPNHQPVFEVDDPNTGFPAPRAALYFPEREGSTHISFGAGFATLRHFQLDVAVDVSEPVRTISLSSIWRF